MDLTRNYISDITLPDTMNHAVFGHVVYQPGSTLGPREQNDLQLVGIESGHATIAVDGKKRVLNEGWMCLLLPGHQEFFRFANKQPTCHNWCSMSFTNIEPWLGYQADTLPFAVPMTPMMQSLIDWGLQAKQMNPNLVSEQLSIHLGQSLFYAWLNAVNMTANGKPKPPAVELAQQYIAHHYAQPILMDDLAEAACVSVNHLTRQFNDHLHITPSRYLWQYRTQRGIELLRHTGLNISQIADRVGFATPFHFSRLVKQKHRCSPKQLREKFWQQESQSVEPRPNLSCF